mmetsp:Transcript_3355/g.4136  ORF Transcript_3355/g.4136 Transcript_3355/m.4136 type:complete len:83 (-) Transcript_3355:34-282(-)
MGEAQRFRCGALATPGGWRATGNGRIVVTCVAGVHGPLLPRLAAYAAWCLRLARSCSLCVGSGEHVQQPLKVMGGVPLSNGS